MTETAPAVFLSPLDNAKLGSCGGPLPRSKAKVLSLENGQSLGPYQRGELYVSGPQVMKGYLNDEKSTRETISDQGWLRTGDVAYYDDDGHFFIVDRVKELIKVKGNQVKRNRINSEQMVTIRANRLHLPSLKTSSASIRPSPIAPSSACRTRSTASFRGRTSSGSRAAKT